MPAGAFHQRADGCLPAHFIGALEEDYIDYLSLMPADEDEGD